MTETSFRDAIKHCFDLKQQDATDAEQKAALRQVLEFMKEPAARKAEREALKNFREKVFGLSAEESPTEKDLLGKLEGFNWEDLENALSGSGKLEGEYWNNEDPIPDREWLIPRALPAKRLASLYGEGGLGKSRLAMQISAAVMHGGFAFKPDPSCYSTVKETLQNEMNDSFSELEDQGLKVLWLTWEDELNEFRRRWQMAVNAEAIDHPFPDPDRLTLVNMRQVGGPLWAPTEGSKHLATQASWTDAGKRFLETMEGHALAVVDPLAAAFGSDENSRTFVRQFTNAFDSHCEKTGCAGLLIGHPSKKSVEGYSGSSDWRASVRASFHLETTDETGWEYDTGIILGNNQPQKKPGKAYRLKNDKSSYSKESAHIWLRSVSKYEDGKSQLGWFATTDDKAAQAYNEAYNKGKKLRRAGKPNSGNNGPSGNRNGNGNAVGRGTKGVS